MSFSIPVSRITNNIGIATLVRIGLQATSFRTFDPRIYLQTLTVVAITHRNDGTWSTAFRLADYLIQHLYLAVDTYCLDTTECGPLHVYGCTRFFTSPILILRTWVGKSAKGSTTHMWLFIYCPKLAFPNLNVVLKHLCSK